MPKEEGTVEPYVSVSGDNDSVTVSAGLKFKF